MLDLFKGKIMKEMSIMLNDPDEAKILERSLIMATGEKQKIKPAKYIFIKSDGSTFFANNELVYQKRIENKISVYDALSYLDGLINKEPFLNRSGQKEKLTISIDSYVKDQFVSMCTNGGLKLEKALENLMAQEIKRKINENI